MEWGLQSRRMEWVACTGFNREQDFATWIGALLPPSGTCYDTFVFLEGKPMKSFTFVAACAALLFASVAPSTANAGCCDPAPAPCCEPAPVCCCPPPPVEVSFCVVDPVTCCKYPVTVCVPAECAGQTPCYVGCRPGFLGRKILTYKFPCCGECVDIVITKFGRVIVRD